MDRKSKLSTFIENHLKHFKDELGADHSFGNEKHEKAASTNKIESETSDPLENKSDSLAQEVDLKTAEDSILLHEKDSENEQTSNSTTSRPEETHNQSLQKDMSSDESQCDRTMDTNKTDVKEKPQLQSLFDLSLRIFRYTKQQLQRVTEYMFPKEKANEPHKKHTGLYLKVNESGQLGDEDNGSDSQPPPLVFSENSYKRDIQVKISDVHPEHVQDEANDRNTSSASIEKGNEHSNNAKDIKNSNQKGNEEKEKMKAFKDDLPQADSEDTESDKNIVQGHKLTAPEVNDLDESPKNISDPSKYIVKTNKQTSSGDTIPKENNHNAKQDIIGKLTEKKTEQESIVTSDSQSVQKGTTVDSVAADFWENKTQGNVLDFDNTQTLPSTPSNDGSTDSRNTQSQEGDENHTEKGVKGEILQTNHKELQEKRAKIILAVGMSAGEFTKASKGFMKDLQSLVESKVDLEYEELSPQPFNPTKRKQWHELLETVKYVLLLCLNQSRLGTDIDAVLEKFKGHQKKIILVVFHHVPDKNVSKITPSRDVLGRQAEGKHIILHLDYAFWKAVGHQCDLNKNTLDKLCNLLESDTDVAKIS